MTRALALVNDIEGLPARSLWTRVCAQKQPVLVPSVGKILPCTSFCYISSLHGNALNSAEVYQKKNTNTESTYDVLAYLVPSFLTFVMHLPASPTSKQVYYHRQQI